MSAAELRAEAARLGGLAAQVGKSQDLMTLRDVLTKYLRAEKLRLEDAALAAEPPAVALSKDGG